MGWDWWEEQMPGWLGGGGEDPSIIHSQSPQQKEVWKVLLPIMQRMGQFAQAPPNMPAMPMGSQYGQMSDAVAMGNVINAVATGAISRPPQTQPRTGAISRPPQTQPRPVMGPGVGPGPGAQGVSQNFTTPSRAVAQPQPSTGGGSALGGISAIGGAMGVVNDKIDAMPGWAKMLGLMTPIGKAYALGRIGADFVSGAMNPHEIQGDLIPLGDIGPGVGENIASRAGIEGAAIDTTTGTVSSADTMAYSAGQAVGNLIDGLVDTGADTDMSAVPDGIFVDPALDMSEAFSDEAIESLLSSINDIDDAGWTSASSLEQWLFEGTDPIGAGQDAEKMRIFQMLQKMQDYRRLADQLGR